MRALISSLRLSKKGFRALDIADSSYTQDSSLEILISIVNTTSSANDLCYLGTLVLPIDGRKRLEFYGLLMRLSRLRCIEVEVTDWDPAPTNRAALRALTCELRLYCPSVTRVVFVYDFDRFMINVVDDLCVFDEDAVTDTLWREV
ncbi:hypothetical protein A0H81_08865 [Grifola frondosa]|uniref:Uncharacterized protein n=1 Tax=Grifola frondosa TaxID=5627 RepID=A0A1C7M3A0_GRIFR|nr:hypothetical protein A0H81_08865 [Grifola frondosa]